MYKIIFTYGTRTAYGVNFAVHLPDNDNRLKSLHPHTSVYQSGLIGMSDVQRV